MLSIAKFTAKLLLLYLLHFYFVNGDDIGENCVDLDPKCSNWAAQGECQTNAAWMMTNCRNSCHSCQGGEKAWKLRALIAAAYNNSTQQNITRTVRVESLRITHVEMEEERQYVRVYGRMVMTWNDSTVAWNREEWGLSWLNFYWIQIWTPQLIQINSASLTPGAITSKVLAANYTGQVYLWSDFTFIAPYNFQYENYPNDFQNVCFKFDDKRYFAVKFLVADDVKQKRHEELSETHTSGWTVESVDLQDSKYVLQVVGDWRRDQYDLEASNCELCLGLRRNAVYYVTEMLLPALITSVLTLSASLFQLSVLQPALLALSIISQFLSLQLISYRLPTFAAHRPVILKYAGFNLITSTILFILALILRQLSRMESEIPAPGWVIRFVTLVNNILRLPVVPSSSTDDNCKVANTTVQCQYASFAHTLNNILFVTFSTTYFFVVIACFVF